MQLYVKLSYSNNLNTIICTHTTASLHQPTQIWPSQQYKERTTKLLLIEGCCRCVELDKRELATPILWQDVVPALRRTKTSITNFITGPTTFKSQASINSIGQLMLHGSRSWRDTTINTSPSKRATSSCQPA